MRIEVPSGRDTQIVIVIVIPIVVDIEAIRIEVTDIDTVTIRIHIIAYSHLCHQKLRFTTYKSLYPLLFVFYLRVVL